MADHRALAEKIRAACIKAALDSYQHAGVAGLCHEGRWEAAISALQSLDVDELLELPSGTEKESN